MSRAGSSRARPVRLLAGLLVPLVAFVAFLQTLRNATEALAIAEALPLLWVLAYAVWRRRIEPVGATAVAGFAVALLLTVVLGGSPRPLELHRAVFPGFAGLACLISLTARRPLLFIAKEKLKHARPETATQAQLDPSGAHHALVMLTAIIGVTLTADAATQVALALTVSTSTFGVVAHIASWAIVGTGLAACVLYMRRTRARRQHSRMPAPSPTSSAQPTDPGAISKPELPPRPTYPRDMPI